MRYPTALILSLGLAARPGLAAVPIVPAALAAPAAAADTGPDMPVFDGGLATSWQDWGWAHRTLEAKKPARLQMAKYAGWILGNPKLHGNFGALQFDLRAPAAFGDFLEVHLAAAADDSLPRVAVAAPHRQPLADGWVRVRIPMAELNPSSAPFDRVRLRAAKSVGPDWIEVDHMVLTGGPSPAAVAAANESAARARPHRPAPLRIDCRAPSTPISPYIYGVAFVPRHAGGDAFQWDLGPTIRRWGGNPASRYNWQLGNAWNTASDWFFQNVNYTGKADYSWKDFLAENRAHQVPAAVTVPMLGWVAKDTDAASFPVSVYGAQQYSQKDAGNGVRKGGGKITADPRRTSIEGTPESTGAWVAAIESSGGGVAQYILDNEPALWNSTHRDVHPNAVTYDELIDKTIAYGSQVRRAAPNASIAGPAEWGWPGYFFSAKDAEVGFARKPDRRAHGDVPLLNYYLRKLRSHHQRTGQRILDVVDLHYYPQTRGLYGQGERTDATASAARIRATRSLWDPTYKDESWINEKIALLPRLKDIIAAEYPGLKISLGEYNFGGEKHISGALALAEALGRFGQAGVHSAYYWTYPPANSSAAQAFRAFRNYDGQGGHFFEQGLATQMAPQTSLYASREADGRKLVAVALNLDADTFADAQVELVGCGDFTQTRAFVYTGGPEGLTQLTEPPAVGAAGLKQALPPYSITVFELSR